MNRRTHILVRGRVQGVGFRPTVFRHATGFGLSGFVKNSPEGVLIEVEGAPEAVSGFIEKLQNEPPRQARIDSILLEELAAIGDSGPFEIGSSRRSGNLQTGMPPDLATCPECLSDILERKNRRFEYPFTNCTNCGPRFTIICELPYDREKTSMAGFALCPECLSEYKDPLDRRFDAQPNACPACGPSLQLLFSSGSLSPKDGSVPEIAMDGEAFSGLSPKDGSVPEIAMDDEAFSGLSTGNCEIFASEDALSNAVKQLKDGNVLAVKGIGGYHLCCDATSDRVVSLLRARKKRPTKALAVMFASLAELEIHCYANSREQREVSGCAAPIVVLRRKNTSGLSLRGRLSALVSPDTDDLGAFLPYYPLHHLLLSRISPLVMTSGNLAEEPIAKDEEEIQHLLGTIADCALIHNRPIVRRCDDSVLKIVADKPLWLRRSRGVVPDPVGMPVNGVSVLACGADLKNTFCLTRQDQAFLSPHIGDLEDFKAWQFYRESIADFSRLLQVQPQFIAHDMHPDYLSTRFAMEQGLPLIPIQHHHAHIASCMAEHGLDGAVIGVALDGTGFGTDSTLWGGEFFICDLRQFSRVAHFKQVPMPGGNEAIRHPSRMAFSYVFAETPSACDSLASALLPEISSHERKIFVKMMRENFNSPLTSSAGRLFDAVAALLGLGDELTYEGRAAIRLQTCADKEISEDCPFFLEEKDPCNILSFGPMILEILSDLNRGLAKSAISGKFHNTLAQAVLETCSGIREKNTGPSLHQVVLSGGVFQNDLLLEKTRKLLSAQGFTVFAHHLVPPNDGGIALGQAAIALARQNREL